MTLHFDPAEGGPIAFDCRALVIAGWTGRDAAAVQHHIEELAALGVAPPSRTPLFYRAAADRLTQAEEIEVLGAGTSGEAEAVLLRQGDRTLVTLGSDHTDREAEAHSVALSKQACPKPVARQCWPFEEVAPHWDRLVLRSWAWFDGRRTLYQEGSLANILAPDVLVADLGPLAPGTALFCGTLPARGGVRPSARFEMELEDPVLERRISHAYRITELPVIA